METCECTNSCQSHEECTNSGNSHTCACPSCYTGPTCSEKINSCACNNPCKPAGLCKDTSLGTAVCKCDCIGYEECVIDTITEREECRCPSCMYSREGERGCLNRVTNKCDCNSCYGDQEVCVDNDDPQGNVQCKIGNPSSGHAFTVVFEENDTEKSFKEIPLEIYFSSAVWNDGDRTVRVSTPGLPFNHYCFVNETVIVKAKTVYRFPLERCLMQNGTGLEHLAIRITELNNRSISVYGINKDRWTADGFLALPDEKAGTEFQTSSYTPAHIATQFAIVTLYDDTEITMTLADDNNLPSPYNKKGSVYTTKLNAFDTFQVQARCDGIPSFRECRLDLTGLGYPIYGKSRDHLIEQILPRDRWGTDFAIVSVPHRVVGDLLQIMAVNGESTICHFYRKFGNQQQEPEIPEKLSLPLEGGTIGS
ncbi:hypothetical protein EB796_015867 [Bugula neritina]|uniref:EGF-like domain-containing protein n=1 Tax=Bugula neritina TaxID=10212 RepID=A0A7J7JHK1_BUGNE|nr:hypothetical protein EB796_015867 [Bugula neritina]